MLFLVNEKLEIISLKFIVVSSTQKVEFITVNSIYWWYQSDGVCVWKASCNYSITIWMNVLHNLKSSPRWTELKAFRTMVFARTFCWWYRMVKVIFLFCIIWVRVSTKRDVEFKFLFIKRITKCTVPYTSTLVHRTYHQTISIRYQLKFFVFPNDCRQFECNLGLLKNFNV